MSAPIPVQYLKHSATLGVPSARDADGNNTYTSYSLTRVVVQPVTQTRRASDNTIVTFSGICFYDAVLSKPKLDIAALKRTADSYGGRMTLLHNSNTYTVVGVDIVHDTNGQVHHYEMLLG